MEAPCDAATRDMMYSVHCKSIYQLTLNGIMYKRRLSQRMLQVPLKWNWFLPCVPIVLSVLSLLPTLATGFTLGGNININGIFLGSNHPRPQWIGSPGVGTTSTRSTTTHLFADLSFSGDSNAFVEFEASVDQVQEWLQTPSASDLQLLGTTQAKRLSKDPDLWECQQPRIDFMGLDLQPYFIHRVERRMTQGTTSSATTGSRKITTVVVKVVDSRTEILNPNNPANQVVGSLMGRAKFSGASRIQALPAASNDRRQQQPYCRLVVDLTLNLHVPLPPFVLLPPGFNSVGSSIVTRTSKGRTQKLVQDLKVAYFEWAATRADNATQSLLEPKQQK